MISRGHLLIAVLLFGLSTALHPPKRPLRGLQATTPVFKVNRIKPTILNQPPLKGSYVFPRFQSSTQMIQTNSGQFFSQEELANPNSLANFVLKSVIDPKETTAVRVLHLSAMPGDGGVQFYRFVLGLNETSASPSYSGIMVTHKGDQNQIEKSPVIKNMEDAFVFDGLTSAQATTPFSFVYGPIAPQATMTVVSAPTAVAVQPVQAVVQTVEPVVQQVVQQVPVLAVQALPAQMIQKTTTQVVTSQPVVEMPKFPEVLPEFTQAAIEKQKLQEQALAQQQAAAAQASQQTTTQVQNQTVVAAPAQIAAVGAQPVTEIIQITETKTVTTTPDAAVIVTKPVVANAGAGSGAVTTTVVTTQTVQGGKTLNFDVLIKGNTLESLQKQLKEETTYYRNIKSQIDNTFNVTIGKTDEGKYILGKISSLMKEDVKQKEKYNAMLNELNAETDQDKRNAIILSLNELNDAILKNDNDLNEFNAKKYILLLDFVKTEKEKIGLAKGIQMLSNSKKLIAELDSRISKFDQSAAKPAGRLLQVVEVDTIPAPSLLRKKWVHPELDDVGFQNQVVLNKLVQNDPKLVQNFAASLIEFINETADRLTPHIFEQQVHYYIDPKSSASVYDFIPSKVSMVQEFNVEPQQSPNVEKKAKDEGEVELTPSQEIAIMENQDQNKTE